MNFNFQKTVNIDFNGIKKQQIRNCLFRYLRDRGFIDCQTSKALLWYVTWFRRSKKDIDAPRLSHSLKCNPFFNRDPSSHDSREYEVKLKTFRTFQRYMEINHPEKIHFLEKIIEGQKTKDHDYVDLYQKESRDYQNMTAIVLSNIAENIHLFMKNQSSHTNRRSKSDSDFRRQGVRR